MEHFRDKTNNWRLIGVVFCKLQCQLESTSIPGRVVRPEDDSVPEHDVIVLGSATDAGRRIMLEAFEVSHQALAGGGRHGYGYGDGEQGTEGLQGNHTDDEQRSFRHSHT